MNKFQHVLSASVPNIQPGLTYEMISQDIKMGLLHKLIAHPEIDTTALSAFSLQAFIQNHRLNQQHTSLWHIYFVC